MQRSMRSWLMVVAALVLPLMVGRLAGAAPAGKTAGPPGPALIGPASLVLDASAYRVGTVPDADSKPAPGKIPDESLPSDRAMIMFEGFEGAFPSAGWTVFDNNGAANGEYYWDDDDYLPYTGSWSAWCANGGADALDPEYYYYPNNCDSWMVYGPFSLADAVDAAATFNWWLQSESGFDYFYWLVSVDGTNFYGWAVSGDSNGWIAETFDLTNVPTLGNVCGQSQVWLAFVFASDGSVVDDGPFVDDIVLSKTPGGGSPDAYEPDDTCPGHGATPPWTQAGHNFHVAGDVDWAYFYAEAGVTYTVGTRNLGSACDTVVWLHDDCGDVVAWDDDSGGGLSSLIVYTPATSHWCDIEVRHYDPGASGPGTNYDLYVEVPMQPQWTILAYMDGDNNLEGAAIGDVNEMEALGSCSGVNVLVQLDRVAGYDSSNGDWTGARRYYITQDSDTATINSTLLADLGEVNMGDPASLTSFVQWGIDNYPADHYLVVVWDHGSGWRQVLSTPPFKGIAYDDTDGDYLTTQELALSLSQIDTLLGRNIDIVGLDACLMQMAEVAYEIRESADYIVGSEETIPWDGYPYDDVLSALCSNPAMSPAELGTALVNAYVASYSGGSQGSASVTLSCLDTTQVPAVASAVDALALALIAGYSAHGAAIDACRTSAQHYYDAEFKDLYDFAECLSAIPESGIQAAAQAVMDAVDAAVTADDYNGSALAGSHGLSIYLPQPLGYQTSYDGLAFAADTNWEEFLQGPPCPPDPYEPDDSCPGNGAPPPWTQAGHNFHVAGDVDWAYFYGDAGVAYTIRTSNLGPACDTVVWLHDDCGGVVAWDDDSGGGLSSLIVYTPATSHWCDIEVRHYNPSASGPDTNYDLSVAMPPTADFSGTPTSGPAPLTVVFTDLSVGDPTSWSWSFGDGGTSPDPSPSHTYGVPDIYTVSLTVTNACGSDTETKPDYITVNAIQTWFEDDDPAISYSGTWAQYTDSRLSAGHLRHSSQLNARATFTFTGTGAIWHMVKGPQMGKARVYLDGGGPYVVDLYARTLTLATLSRTGLAPGSHTAVIEVARQKRFFSSGYTVTLDAVEVLP